jgi:hypothetical protein
MPDLDVPALDNLKEKLNSFNGYYFVAQGSVQARKIMPKMLCIKLIVTSIFVAQ